MTQLSNRGPNVVDRAIFVLNFVIEELRTSVFYYSATWAVKIELLCLGANTNYNERITTMVDHE